MSIGDVYLDRKVDLVNDTSDKVQTDKTLNQRAAELSPRLRETLNCLLDGATEKAIAKQLELSPHTVHGYVKLIYRHFKVKSRAQLLSQWVRAAHFVLVAAYALAG